MAIDRTIPASESHVSASGEWTLGGWYLGEWYSTNVAWYFWIAGTALFSSLCVSGKIDHLVLTLARGVLQF